MGLCAIIETGGAASVGGVMIHIVPFEADLHKAVLSDIWFRASMQAHPFIGEATLREQQPLMEDVYLPMATTSVAVKDGRIAGFASLLKDHIAALFVDPTAQGQGIGRELLDHASQEREQLSLEVYLHNPKAVEFYERYGFVIESRREVDDQGQPFPNARMIWRRP